jgi:hypothetical protein
MVRTPAKLPGSATGRASSKKLAREFGKKERAAADA